MRLPDDAHRALARVTALLALAVTLASAAVAVAEEPWSLEVGFRSWLTGGYTKDASSLSGIDPLSELRWRGTDAVVVEGTADLVVERFLFRLTFGGNRVEEGAFIDDDFLFTDRQGRFSHTRSVVDDSHILYVIGDFGVRALEWRGLWGGERGYLDAFVGYQYWNEKYVSFGLQGGGPGLDTVTGRSTATKVHTEDISWKSARLGMRTQVPIIGGLSLRGEAVVLPHTFTQRDDIHHLRTDLLQNPSFAFSASGGIGYQLDAGLSYRVWQGLSIDAGYRLWGLESSTGRETARGVSGPSTLDAGIETERAGPYLGVQYRF
jgi:hypothetical protein